MKISHYLHLFYMQMRLALILILLAIAGVGRVSAQQAPNSDYRAKLNVYGRVNNISVLSDNSIWFGSMTGELYSTEAFEKPWRYRIKSNDATSYDQYDAVVGWGDTILVIGQVHRDGYHPNSILRSTNKGATWDRLPFTETGTLQVHAVDYNHKGEVWIAGGPARLFYSSDYGRSWSEKTSPDKTNAARIYALRMVDSKHGYAASHNGKILETKDNGVNWQQIPTPADQKVHSLIVGDWRSGRMDNVTFTDEALLVVQGDNLYATKRNVIQWELLLKNVAHISANREGDYVYAIDNNKEVTVYDHALTVKNSFRLHKYATAITATQDNAVILADNYLYRISPAKVDSTLLVTMDHPIEAPQLEKKGTMVRWGLTDREIFITPYNTREWSRIATLDKPMQSFRLLNDNEAVFYDGFSSSYLFNRKTNELMKYYETDPLAHFLKSPVINIKIETGSRGCFHHENSVLLFERNKRDNQFILNRKELKGAITTRFKQPQFFPEPDVTRMLQELNQNPDPTLLMKDLKITETDLEHARKTVPRPTKKRNTSSDKEIDVDRYIEALNHLDTVSSYTLNNLITSGTPGWSTTSEWFVVTLTNDQGEEMKISHNFYFNPPSWLLPWTVTMDDISFASKNLEIARFINQILPEDFPNKEVFSNQQIIDAIIRQQLRTR